MPPSRLTDDDVEFLTAMSDRMRTGRAMRGLTLDQLAKASGTTRNTIHALCRNKKEKPDLVLIRRIAHALDVSLAWLAGEDNTWPF